MKLNRKISLKLVFIPYLQDTLQILKLRLSNLIGLLSDTDNVHIMLLTQNLLNTGLLFWAFVLCSHASESVLCCGEWKLLPLPCPSHHPYFWLRHHEPLDTKSLVQSEGFCSGSTNHHSRDLLSVFYVQALNEGRKKIREECATLGTAETWEPFDLRKDQPKLTGEVLLGYSPHRWQTAWCS